jgi:hypothetical protein
VTPIARDGEPEPQAASIRAPLLEGRKQLLGIPGKPAALVLDRDERVVLVCVRPHDDMASGARELESVLNQVRDHGREDLPVHLDRNACRDGGDGELHAPGLGFDRRGDFHFLDELGQRDSLAFLDACLEAHLGERAIDQIAHAGQVAAEQRARAAADAHAAVLENLEGQHGIAEHVAQLVREESQPLGLVFRDRQLALAAELGNGFRHRLVEAAV